MAKFQSDGENEKRTKSKNLNPFFKSQAKIKKKETKNENQIRFSMSRVDEKRKMEWKSNSVLQGG